jgi:hypothetical protein
MMFRVEKLITAEHRNETLTMMRCLNEWITNWSVCVIPMRVTAFDRRRVT